MPELTSILLLMNINNGLSTVNTLYIFHYTDKDTQIYNSHSCSAPSYNTPKIKEINIYWNTIRVYTKAMDKRIGFDSIFIHFLVVFR